MPDGRVHRIDPDTESVYIIRRGRTYRAPLNEVEAAARVPSARVQFGLRRRNGEESAEGVTLRRGTRTNKRHRRFGDLTGAARPGAKTRTRTQQDFGIDVTTQPRRVAEAWVNAMNTADFDGAASLYLPEAKVHTDAGTISGRRKVRAALEDCGWEVGQSDVTFHVDDRFVDIHHGGSAHELDSSLMISKGAIVEHWFGPSYESGAEKEDDQPVIEVVNRTGVSAVAVTNAEERMSTVIAGIPEKVLSARIKLALAPKPRSMLAAHVETTFELENGGVIRVHAGATTLSEAIDQALSKFAAKLERTRDRDRHNPTGVAPNPNQWRHANRPSDGLPYFDRPPEEREIVRHKTVAASQMTIEEAAWDADLMAFDFFLFEEISTGHDCLLERNDDAYVVYGMGLGVQTIPSAMGDLNTSDATVPTERLSAAIEILHGSGAPYHFFINEATGRGNVIYRRLDGHYGLITPRVSVTRTD